MEATPRAVSTRRFHDYYITQVPTSSLYPDKTASFYDKLPSAPEPNNAAANTNHSSHHDIVGPISSVVRIPLRKAKYHFGVSMSRGNRSHNEDAFQAGVIDIPAFAKRVPRSMTLAEIKKKHDTSFSGPKDQDPQVLYFGIFDGHGGVQCSDFLKDRLHEYIQEATVDFELQSSLIKTDNPGLEHLRMSTLKREGPSSKFLNGETPLYQTANSSRISQMEALLVAQYSDLVGGYFRRFKPRHFHHIIEDEAKDSRLSEQLRKGTSMEAVLEYAFLKADLDFISAQAAKSDFDLVQDEKPLNTYDVLANPSRAPFSPRIGGPRRFFGGSTCSIAMISTPSRLPFWHPSAPCTLLTSHVGDTRVILCSTATGAAIPLTASHHPSSPVEAQRLRRYSHSLVTDSFGEERISGFANTRAFGDIGSKRLGISAEPETRRIDLAPAECAFMVLVSDGVSDPLLDQEIVDIVKEAKSPDQASRDVVNFATEVCANPDNATCLVVRLGGWERRLEGGVGSMGTKADRDWKRNEAANPRRRT